MARFSLLNRIRRQPESDSGEAPPRPLRRAPSPGALRRERRAILKAREEQIRDLGGLTLEMYRRSSFRDDLLIDKCREIVALEERLHELDSMLDAVASARRAPATCECGAPVPWGSHFCANCGRPTGPEPVVSCANCGHPLPADAKFCASCGQAAGPDASGEHGAADNGADPWER
ncbi:MAG TPA: zinc ribbon domain-containing protein [Gaiellaceae bacterium]|nr:zinc ribbon domain-containing protein [Gaiellaceae bacterium]